MFRRAKVSPLSTKVAFPYAHAPQNSTLSSEPKLGGRCVSPGLALIGMKSTFHLILAPFWSSSLPPPASLSSQPKMQSPHSCPGQRSSAGETWVTYQYSPWKEEKLEKHCSKLRKVNAGVPWKGPSTPNQCHSTWVYVPLLIITMAHGSQSRRENQNEEVDTEDERNIQIEVANPRDAIRPGNLELWHTSERASLLCISYDLHGWNRK